MKYKTLGAIKGVQNVPYCKAAADIDRKSTRLNSSH